MSNYYHNQSLLQAEHFRLMSCWQLVPTSNEDDLKYEDNLKYDDNLKNKDDLKNPSPSQAGV